MDIIYKLKQLSKNNGTTKYLKNTSWLIGEKILRMTVGLFVSLWVAKYLGPEKFGLLTYSQSYVALFAVIATLGLDGIVIRELVSKQDNKDALLGTAFTLKVLGSLLVLLFIIISIMLNYNDDRASEMIMIISLATVLQSFNVIDFYFQSKVLSKFVVYSNTISLVISSITKVVLILKQAELISFAYVILFDSFILSCGLIYYYFYNGNKIKLWCFNLCLALSLLKDSWPLIISSLVVTIYMKIDVIMLNSFLGEYEVGLYSASTRISELWYFIPVLITSSLFPAILNAKTQNLEIYHNRIKNLYKILVWMAVFLSVFVSFTSDYLMMILFGNEYIDSAKILDIQIWSSIFICLLMVSNKCLLSENKTKFIFVRGMCGAIINVILNYIFIPQYGVNAAAITSLVTLMFTSLIIDVFTPATRQHLYLKLDVFLLKFHKIH